MTFFATYDDPDHLVDELICRAIAREEADEEFDAENIFRLRNAENFVNAFKLRSVNEAPQAFERLKERIGGDQVDCSFFTVFCTEVLGKDKIGLQTVAGVESKGNGYHSAMDLVRQHSAEGDKVSQGILNNFEERCNKTKRSKLESENLTENSMEDTKMYKELNGDIPCHIIERILGTKLSPSDFVNESDIAGLGSIKKLIKDKIISPIKRPELHFGLHRAPKGVLLFGPPGTGKTLLAKWIATASQATFFEISPSVLISKYFGETETIARTLFQVAEAHSPAIIFIDEIDGVFGKRQEREDESTIRMKNQLLQMMDGVASNSQTTVIVIGATNRPETLDAAALRRLTRRVLVPLPDQEARQTQLKLLLTRHYSCRSNFEQQKMTHADLQDIAQKLDGWNGSDIKALCTKAADYTYDDALIKYGNMECIPDYNAFREIEVEDFIKALKEVRPSYKPTNSLISWCDNFGCA